MEDMKMNEEKHKTLTIWALKRVKRGIINVKLQELLWSSTRPKVVDQISQLPDALLLRSLIPTDQTLVTTAHSKRWHYLWNWLDTFCFSTFNYHERYVYYVHYVLGYSISSKIKKSNLIALNQMHTGGKYETPISFWRRGLCIALMFMHLFIVYNTNFGILMLMCP